MGASPQPDRGAVAGDLGEQLDVAATVTHAALGSDAPVQAASKVAVGHAADHLPNATATDWVSYADHVVLVSPVTEQVVPPAATELERGEGLIGRTLGMRVDQVLWSAKGAAAAPKQFDWQAFGWQFSDDDVDALVPLAAEDAPRLELGHQYVLAIRWESARCTDGDQVAAQWQGLGADAMVPADGGVIGNGELEGTDQSVAQARSRASATSTGGTLEDELAGRRVGELVSVLAATTPQPTSTLTYAAAPEAC